MTGTASWAGEAASFDELIHSPTRLRICAALEASTELEFAALERGLGLSASLLSKQLKVLLDAGYVALDKRRQPVGRPRTWVSLTTSGRRTYRCHVAALRGIVGPLDTGP